MTALERMPANEDYEERKIRLKKMTIGEIITNKSIYPLIARGDP